MVSFVYFSAAFIFIHGFRSWLSSPLWELYSVEQAFLQRMLSFFWFVCFSVALACWVFIRGCGARVPVCAGVVLGLPLFFPYWRR